MKAVPYFLIQPEDHADASKRAQEIALRALLRARLLSLSFHAFEACIRELLLALGYSEVTLLGRTHLKQATRHGGRDMEVASRAGLTGTRLLVQVKQYTRPVSRRFVDELKGVLLRCPAEQAMILSTGPFSKVARRVALSDYLAPIRLVDGEELLDLLCLCQIGIMEKRRRGRERFYVDEAYFRALEHDFPPSPKAAARQAAGNANYIHKHNAGGAAVAERCLKGGGMLWHTHAMGGIASLWALHLVPGGITPDTLVLVSGCAVLGALLPDLDAAEAKIKHLSVGGVAPFAPLSAVLHRTLGHRGLLHSLPGVMLVSVLALPIALFLGWQPWVALILGYSSHIALDSLTPSGVPLVPFRDQRSHLLPRTLRITTGSPAEEIVFILLSLAAVWLLLLVLSPVHAA